MAYTAIQIQPMSKVCTYANTRLACSMAQCNLFHEFANKMSIPDLRVCDWYTRL